MDQQLRDRVIERIKQEYPPERQERLLTALEQVEEEMDHDNA